MTPTGATAKERRVSPGIVAAIAAISSVGVAVGLGNPLLALVMEARGASGTFIGVNTAFAGIVSMAASPFVSPLALRFGTVRLLTASILLTAAAFPGFYLVENLWLWFPLRALFTIGLTCAFVLSEFWINDLAPAHRRGLLMGIYATILSLGFALGPIILSAVGSAGVLPFLVGTAIIAAAAIPGILARRDEPVLSEPQRMSFVAFIFAVPLATFGVAVFGAVESSLFALLPIYSLRLGYDEAAAVLFSAVVPIGNMMLLIPLGLLADRMDRRRLLLIIGLIGATGAAALPLAAHNALTFGATLFFWGGIIAGLYTVGLTHLASRFTGSDLAAANAAFVLMYSVGMAVGPAAVGGGIDLVPPHGFAFVMVVFFVAYVALALSRGALRREG